jgi:uncharacterized protein
MTTHSEVRGGQKAKLAEIEAWVRATLMGAEMRAHGWFHTDRVRANIRILARAEGVDAFQAEVAALLHDVGRTQPGPEAEHGARSASIARPLLEALDLPDGEVQAIIHAIRWHNSLRDDTPLLCILRDADMLDGLGAVGIMRAFMSKSHLPPYDAAEPFQGGRESWPPSYCSDQLLGQMAWYERLNTDTARRMAKTRIEFMALFIDKARDEIMIRTEDKIANA